ncbi:hypothetical protein F442_11738 [Phytophthora nicotianae P10297]|uniref:Uncharacterized protein n=6 Tax=Phytophthora nicotianae TaxID=4792 RepID=W2Q087_PHYN3|nr:hypothetical protein PPTG_12642 [Phytophthora nicotianae INRA-310]ETN06532.1 hypothetical protein PPTG_12642 [Phytophthora nicotianae INRA-310]ETP41045.1 hypothetical protein F442_11738 [Phytophthora nicotianae P10297]KUF83482.1 hypothetical protein AM587_10003325 [Phytophthora nicotianae]
MVATNNHSKDINASSTPAQHSKPHRSLKREAESVSAVTNIDEPPSKRPYYGKCQYKTGKCFNERTLKRNGEAHSLCEEHRVKQNLIQRRSDRKYQTVHAIRRRERSQRRAVLKKQVSMAVAQQLFYEHQQQKTLGIPLPQHHPLHLLTANTTGSPTTAPGTTGLAAPIQVPHPASAFMLDGQRNIGAPLMLSFRPHPGRATVAHSRMVGPSGPPATAVKDESTPTGIDNFAPDSFLNIPAPPGHSLPASRDQETAGSNGLSDNHGYVPIMSRTDNKETWSDDDIEFLQTVLLA